MTYFRAGGFDGFDRCFAEHDKLRPLNLQVGRSRSVRAAARAANAAFAAELRDEMRRALREADGDEMPFKPSGEVAAPIGAADARRLRGRGGAAGSAIGLDGCE